MALQLVRLDAQPREIAVTKVGMIVEAARSFWISAVHSNAFVGSVFRIPSSVRQWAY
jgi:hypothetical protein